MRSYRYIGPPDLIPKGAFPPRTLVDSRNTLKNWITDHADEIDIEDNIAATFIVDINYLLWIADRSSEHVECARESDVLSAGEIFSTYLNGEPAIDHITNQSTGYCPEPESYPAIKRALYTTDISYPASYEPEFIFRLCTKCEAKDSQKRTI